MELFEPSLKLHNLDFNYNTSIIQKSNGQKVYKDVVILTPGVWADSISNSQIMYKEDVIRRDYSNWDNLKYVNLGHSHFPLDLVGTVQDPYYDNGVRADLRLNSNTSNGRDIIELIDQGLINKLSVELRTQDYWDSQNMVRCVGKALFMGVSILGPNQTPACAEARIK